LLSAFAAAVSRTFASEPKIAVPSYNRMTDSEEMAAGRELSKTLEKQENLKFVDLPQIQRYADRILERLAKASQRPNLDYSIKVVDTKEINAMALPGGFVYLNRGLIEAAHDESEMVAALAHEVGHVAGHHGANNMTRESSADSLVSEASRVLLGDEGPAKILKQIGSPVAALALLKYDRSQELEADILGYYNMQRAGWGPNGMLSMFKRFDDSAGPTDYLFSFVSTHPSWSEREEQIKEEMRQSPPSNRLLSDSNDFRSVQAEIKKLPPPTKPVRKSANQER